MQHSDPFEIAPMIVEFAGVFPEDLLDKFSPMCDIKHAIDLISRVSLPNLSYYRMNPTEHVELKR